MKYFKLTLTLLFLLFVNYSCQKNPATGQNEINIMSEEEENLIGKNEHQKIIKQFGGEYNDPKIKNYVESIGNFLINTSEQPNKKFKFTILNTPLINAFALPGGYIYLTRGLIYLCQNEAQLAGVIAHEIGHITAKHSARRYTKTISAGIALQILNIFTNNSFLNNLLGQSAELFLLSYSRSQEYQADQLAVRYMTRAGFDAKEMGNFLAIMEKYSNLQKKQYNIKNNIPELLKTHPNNSKRVKEVIESYKGKIPLNPIIGEEIFLKKIDGLLFGHKQEDGFFIRNSFIHKPLKIKFNFDKDFYFLNNPKLLIGNTKKETKVIFDLDETTKENDLNYVSDWVALPKKKINNFKLFKNNGFKISTGKFKKKDQLILFATLNNNLGLTFRFVLLSNDNEIKFFNNKFEEMILSFTQINEENLAEIQPPSIKILSVPSDKNFVNKTLSNVNLQSMFSKETFFILNGLKSEDLDLGKKIKTIY